MRILIVGSGMYVTGREGTGTGTILSSLAESSKNFPIEEIVVVSKNESSGNGVYESAQRINRLLGTSLKISFKALGDNSEKVIKELNLEKKFDACIIAVPDH